jgi:hypothetical protein
MHAEHPVGVLVGQNLHEAFGLLVGLGATVRRGRNLVDLVGEGATSLSTP